MMRLASDRYEHAIEAPPPKRLSLAIISNAKERAPTAVKDIDQKKPKAIERERSQQ